MNNIDKKIRETLEILKKVKNKEIYNNTLEEYEIKANQSFNNKEYDFDVDSSPEAWQYFCEMKGLKYEEIKRDIEIVGRKGATRLTLVWNNIDVAGDCSFNFNKNKIELYMKMLSEKENEDNELKEKLSICSHMHHNLLNFDLMPCTGALNNVKGNLKYDNNKSKNNVNEAACRM